MSRLKKSSPFWIALVIPVGIAFLVFCVAMGYWCYYRGREKAYQKRWAEYDFCGL